MAEKSPEKPKSLASNLLAFIGLILLVVILLWGAIHLLRLASAGFTSLLSSFSRKDALPAVQMPAIATSSPANAAPIRSAPVAPASTTSRIAQGSPDLSVRILAVGVIDSSGALVQRAPLNQGEVVAVRFSVANSGTKASGTYGFTAALPTAPGYTYTAPAQASLAPGAHIENTLRFTQIQRGGGTFTVSVDPSNRVKESSERNNSASITVPGPMY